MSWEDLSTGATRHEQCALPLMVHNSGLQSRIQVVELINEIHISCHKCNAAIAIQCDNIILPFCANCIT